MQNVQMKLNGNVLEIRVDLSQPGAMSRSGKSNVIGSTEGNVTVPGKPEVKVGLNVYTARG